MTGELYINGNDAYTEYGVSLTFGSRSNILTPPPMKEYIENTSRLEHGTRVTLLNPKIGERELNLEVHFVAPNEQSFWMRYNKFCDVLKEGELNIVLGCNPGVTYKFIYLSCTNFSEFQLGIAKYQLRLREANPNDR